MVATPTEVHFKNQNSYQSIRWFHEIGEVGTSLYVRFEHILTVVIRCDDVAPCESLALEQVTLQLGSQAQVVVGPHEERELVKAWEVLCQPIDRRGHDLPWPRGEEDDVASPVDTQVDLSSIDHRIIQAVGVIRIVTGARRWVFR